MLLWLYSVLITSIFQFGIHLHKVPNSIFDFPSRVVYVVYFSAEQIDRSILSPVSPPASKRPSLLYNSRMFQHLKWLPISGVLGFHLPWRWPSSYSYILPVDALMQIFMVTSFSNSKLNETTGPDGAKLGPFNANRYVHLLNQSLITCEFSKNWYHTWVTTIHKKGAKMNAPNY